MTLSPAQKGIACATIAAAIISPVFYLIIMSMVGAPILLINIPYGMMAGGIFGLITAVAVEAMTFFYRDTKPGLGILSFFFASIAGYMILSHFLGYPFLSESMTDGLVGAGFFGLFGGALLFFAYIDGRNGHIFYAVSGMVAGFVQHPVSAVFGLTDQVTVKGALTLALMGLLVALVQYFFMRKALNAELAKLASWAKDRDPGPTRTIRKS